MGKGNNRKARITVQWKPALDFRPRSRQSEFRVSTGNGNYTDCVNRIRKRDLKKEDIGKKWYCYWSATKSMALLVMATDFAGSFSIPVMARMQSIFSTTTSASW